MIADFTAEQLRQTAIAEDRSLVICDVDDVVVHFVREFEHYLSERAMYLNIGSFALNGNVRHRHNDAEVDAAAVAEVVDTFFHDRTAHLNAIDGAVQSLLDLSETATVVMLTNLPHHAREKRIGNLQRHGLPFPVITNSGPKGPAIRALSRRTRKPVVFVDDSPGFIQSARDHAPEVHLVHFLHDERFRRHVAPLDFVSLRTDHWDEALPHIRSLLAG